MRKDRKEQGIICFVYLVLALLAQGTSIGQSRMFFACWLIFLVGIVKKYGESLRRKRKDEIFLELAFFCGFVSILAQIFAGLLGQGFSLSPYDKSISGMLTNGVRVFLPLMVREMVRGILLEGMERERKEGRKWAFLYLFAIGFTLLQLNLEKISMLHGTKEIGKEVFQSVLPLFVEQICLNCFVLYGGFRASLLYAGMTEAFHWFFPIVPEMNWLVKTVIKLLVPAVFALLAADKGEEIYGEKLKRQESFGIGTSAVLGGCVLIVWFFIGVFPVYPSVILTGSMEPWIHPGDFILIEKIQSQSELMHLKKGDVIHFQRDDIYISHRIVDILEDENGNRVFQTKGDNNVSEDVRLVQLKEVKGIVRYRVPKAGLPVLWCKGDTTEFQQE